MSDEYSSDRGHHPDKWVVIDYTSKVGKPEYSLMCGWYGGFAGANSWRRSSPIVSVEHMQINDASILDGWVATTGSGTKYYLYKGTIGVSMLTSGLLEQASLDYIGEWEEADKIFKEWSNV